jgi:putative N-acetyltransferase (TIGR04045 family)
MLGQVLLGASLTAAPAWTIEIAQDYEDYYALRREIFVDEQGLFERDDRDEVDDDPRRIVLLARNHDGTVIGGVRLAPALTGTDIGWWNGGRLAVSRAGRHYGGVGAALVRAACAHAEGSGVIRFEATVQAGNEAMFRRLGWHRVRAVEVAGAPHLQMRWPIDRFATLAQATKAALGPLLAGLHLGGPGFVGDDGVVVPGSDLIAACDAIIPSLVERDPEWAGWCSVLVNVNDLSAMGAQPVGLLDSVAARDASFAARILSGLRQASQAWGIPVLGGHTQLGVPAALSITALGRTDRPVRSAGGRPGQAVSLTADLSGHWRRGHTGRQWDSSTGRSPAELRAMTALVARHNPAAAKDVSMAGLVGTLGMLAESSGCAAVLDVAAIPRPAAASMGDWLSCFPGFAMLTADEPGHAMPDSPTTTSAVCGQLVGGEGVSLRWPDGEITEAIAGAVTGLGASGTEDH